MITLERILFIPILIFSVVIHECAHGLAAYRAGDPTAKSMGRITLNPIPHIDLIGSIILPLFLLLSGSAFLFGWAKPVPVNPSYFKNYRQDEIRVSFAGPASNLLLSFVFLILAILFVATGTGSELIIRLLRIGMLLNLVLAFFNLLPIPPLDGSHILENVLPAKYARYIAMIRPYGFVILMLFFMTPLFDYIYIPVGIVFSFYTGILTAFM